MTGHVQKFGTPTPPDSPLYGVSPLALAELFRLPHWFAARWKVQLRRSKQDAEAVARFVRKDLGAFDPAWAGWTCKDGLIWPPHGDGNPATPGQVLSIPLIREQLREYERAQKWMLEHSTEGRRTEQIAAEVSALLERAIEALRQREAK